jgi:phosphonate transport system substrate-binding protein
MEKGFQIGEMRSHRTFPKPFPAGRRPRRWTPWLLCTLPFLAPFARAAEPQPLVLGVHPFLSAPEVQRRFAPLADYLKSRMGRPVVVRVGGSYEDHERFVGRDAVDIAYVGPAPYVHIVAAYGRKPLLARVERAGKPELAGVIFVRRDSPIQRLSDLRGKHFAFGAPDSTMGAIVPRYFLRQNGIELTDLGPVSNVQSHENVVLGVLGGDFDAGAVRRDIFDEMADRGLRAIGEMPPVSEHAFIARSDLPEADVRRLRESLLQLRSQPDGPRILQAIGTGITGLVPAQDSDYDGMRRILQALEKAKG